MSTRSHAKDPKTPDAAATTLLFAVITWNRRDYLKECVDSWLATRDPAFHWIVAIADDGSTDGTLDYLASLDLPHETHILRNYRRYAAGQTNTILQLSTKLDYDIGFKVDDDVIFRKPGWDRLYVEAVRNSGFGHLCHLNHRHFVKMQQRQVAGYSLAKPNLDPSKSCEAHINVHNCQGSLFTFVPAMLKDIGDADELNFPTRGQWHIDYSHRACRAGHNDPNKFYDARGSNDFIDLQENQPSYQCSLPWGDEYRKTKDPAELERRDSILRDDQRIYVPLKTYRTPASKPARVTLNDEFEKIFVLNLDRRLDRWVHVSAQAAAHGVTIQRWSAADGQTDPLMQQWRDYSAQPLTEAPAGARPVLDSRDFFLHYDCTAARVAYQETRYQGKAIRTPGAWGYLHTMCNLIRHAMDSKLENFLALDDDVLFHQDLGNRFSSYINQLPRDWTILQLGALQYHWENDWIDWYAANAYLCGGSSIGSHAVAVHNRAFETILKECERFRLPYDLGALSLAKHRYRDSAFTLYPNLMIQDVSESDISSSQVQEAEGQRQNNVYRWHLENYDSPRRFAQAG